jgi:hypothetical protein
MNEEAPTRYILVERYPESPELNTIGWVSNRSLCFICPNGREYFRSSAGGADELVKTFTFDKFWKPLKLNSKKK